MMQQTTERVAVSDVDAMSRDADASRALQTADPETVDSEEDRRAYLIVGGGAGGLELACKLGRKLGRGKVTLVDTQLDHVWKPSLHEVAAGTIDAGKEGLSYLMLGHDNGFDFILGAMTGLDTDARHITVGEVLGNDGDPLLPERRLSYQSLVIAVGSTANYFGIPGAEEHAIALNDAPGAERFRYRMLKALAGADQRKRAGAAAGIDIVIIGGGSTGVELAAELREASKMLVTYGFRQLDPDKDVRLTLLEGAPRILPPLPDKVAAEAASMLASRNVTVHADCKVASVTADHVEDESGTRYPADLCVWTAGIKAPAFLTQIGLPTTDNDLLEVDSQLRVKGEEEIYALGDCAFLEDEEGQRIPPRAQTATQQADYLLKRLVSRDQGRTPDEKPYVYRDRGSLVSLGSDGTVGNVTGPLSKSSWLVGGLFARTMYIGLHLMHHKALMGTLRTGVLALARLLVRRTKPLVKLH